MEELLWTATVKSPFGIDGELKIHTHNNDPSYLKKVKAVVLRAKDGTEQRLAVESFRVVGTQAVMKFAGYDSPEKARVLNGCHLLVERSKASPLAKGQYYVADLIGCTLVHEGSVLATVENSVDGAQAVLLEVRTQDDRICMVPYMKEYIGEVDLSKRTIELKTPWILA